MNKIIIVILLIMFMSVFQGCNDSLKGSKPLSVRIQKIHEGIIEDILIFEGLDRAYVAVSFDNDVDMLIHSLYGDIEKGQTGSLYVIEPTLYAPFFTYIWEKD